MVGTRRDGTRRPLVRTSLAGLACALIAACSGTGDDGAPDPSPGPDDRARAVARLAPRCLPPIPLALGGADVVNAIVGLADLPRWQAGDIGASAALADGRIAWVFGDTVRKPSVQPRIVANSLLLSSGLCVSQYLPPDGGPAIPDARPGVVHWPMSVTQFQSGGRTLLVVLASRIDRGDGQQFGFRYLGSSAAVFEVPRLGTPRLLTVRPITPDDRSADQVNWGAASTVSGRWLYVYGTRLTGEEYVFGRELYVARAPTADAGDPRRWQFWSGSAWTRRPASAGPILPAEGGVSQTLSVDRVDGRFVAVSKRDGDLGDFVYTWTAPDATGPWTPNEAIRAPFTVNKSDLQYAPLAHPEVELTGNRLLVSISRNTTDLNRLLEQPHVGRPRFVAVPLPE